MNRAALTAFLLLSASLVHADHMIKKKKVVLRKFAPITVTADLTNATTYQVKISTKIKKVNQ